MHITNLKIGTRLALAFAVVLSLTVLMTIVGVSRLHALSQATTDMEESTISERLAAAWSAGVNANLVRTFARARTTSAADEAIYKKEMDAQSANLSKLQKDLEDKVRSGEGKQLLDTAAEKRKEYVAARDSVFQLKRAMQPGDETTLAKVIDDKLVPAVNEYSKAVSNVLERQTDKFKNSKRAADEVFAAGRDQLMIFGGLAVALGVLLAWLLSRSITHPLAYAVKVAQSVASGDLSSRIYVHSKDETGQLLQALQNMNAQLLDIVGRVKTGTETIATASSQIAAGNLDLSSRTEQQASSLEETASSMEELTSTVKQNADNARQANQLANQASDVARKGGEVVSQVVVTMTAINDSSRKIVDIISVIDGIAFQTNILALNAAVEAARAGEQGRGFAVVASEVRNLAQRSAAAAKEIKLMIGDSVEKVDSGAKLVNEAGTTMDKIVDSIKRVTDIMGEISVASQEQTAGIEQINQAVAEMDNVTQQNAALVEEAAASAGALQEQAASLSEVVKVFITGNEQFSERIATESFRQTTSPMHGLFLGPAILPQSAMHKKRAETLPIVPRQLPSNKTKIATCSATSNSDWEEF